jgi:hypothetical protein
MRLFANHAGFTSRVEGTTLAPPWVIIPRQISLQDDLTK